MKETKKIKRQFLWGWGVEGRKIAWVKCDSISKPKEMEWEESKS